jgi:HK97 family phage portal protein
VASDRAARGQGTEYSLSNVRVTYSMGANTNIGAAWFGPLQPMPATAPPAVRGRQFDFPSGYNLQTTPRAYTNIGFQQLRNIADSYDILRLVIETRKDQVARMKWNVVPRDPKKPVKGAIAERIKTIEDFFTRPDKEHFWDEWIRMVLEDLLVLDAPTLWKRKTRGGQLYALEPLDGATIKPVIDDWGRIPDEGVAYQQVLKGYPAVDYTKSDLIYKPRNLRTNKVYGYSPVEQSLMTIAVGLKRQVYQLNFFTEGNIPDALIGVPETWTPDQIADFQDWFDGMLQGNLETRRRARFVPSAVGKTYIPTKETELFGKAEEWLARVICFAFSISPQPFIQQMNRATAESSAETAELEGLGPILLWIKGLVDGVIMDEFGFSDVMFAWDMDVEVDPSKRAAMLDKLTSAGIMSINESRVALGLDPREEGKGIFNDLMYKSSMGYVQIKNGYIPTTAQTSSAQGASGGRPGNPENDGVDDPGSTEGDVDGDQPETGTNDVE